MRYRRVRIPGGTYFFAAVTCKRAKMFDDATAVGGLAAAIAQVQARWGPAEASSGRYRLALSGASGYASRSSASLPRQPQ
jgi:hypothetical protein